MNKRSKLVPKEKRYTSELFTQIMGVLLMGLAVLMVVSLVSQAPEDPPNSSRPPELAVNLVGWVGAHFSYYILFLIGQGAYVLTLLVFLWGWNRFRQASVLPLVGKSAAMLSMVVIYCGATGIPSRGKSYESFRLGGWLGVTLSSTVLVPYLGKIGSYVCLWTAAVVVMMLATHIPFSRIPDLLLEVGRRLLTWATSLGRSFAGLGRSVALIPGWLWRSWESLKRRRRTKKAQVKEVVGEPELPALANGAPAPVSQGDLETNLQTDIPPDPVKQNGEQPVVFTPAVEQPVKKVASRSLFGKDGDYSLPDLGLLDDPLITDDRVDRDHLIESGKILERSLASFGIEGKVVQINPGPVITTFEVEPPAGVKVNRIVNLADDLALVMKARRIRIQAPIPGKAAVGVEVPNRRPSTVYLKEVLSSGAFKEATKGLTITLGKTATGEPFIADLTTMPHLLIAGATGSGKSVCVNALVSSILFRRSPKEVRFLMVDPKMLELSVYDDIPHLLAPVLTEPKNAAEALKWAVTEMEIRYRMLARYGVRNIDDFNTKLERIRREAETDEDREEVPELLPYIVIVIDELADLMMTAPADIEDSLARLAQMARAVGIHLILATQRPSVNVITGTIKANFPSRIAFRVATKVDSRTILDVNGAEKLLGQGDMLFLPSGRPEPLRVHGAYISTEETERLVACVKDQDVEVEAIDFGTQMSDLGKPDVSRDERFDEALRLVVTHQQGSASLLQRRMKVGYARAARLIDELEVAGIVSTSDGSSRSRDVLVGEDYLEKLETQ